MVNIALSYRVLYIPGGCLGFLPSTVPRNILLFTKFWKSRWTLENWSWSISLTDPDRFELKMPLTHTVWTFWGGWERCSIAVWLWQEILVFLEMVGLCRSNHGKSRYSNRTSNICWSWTAWYDLSWRSRGEFQKRWKTQAAGEWR